MSETSKIVTYTQSEIDAMIARGEDQTRDDAPEAEDDLGEHFWDNARVVMPRSKASVHLRVDADVMEWFRSKGAGHLTRMNAVLKAYVEAHKRSASQVK